MYDIRIRHHSKLKEGGIGKMGLAHVASAQGMTTVPLNYADIPRCTYAHPEVASVGLSEARARELGMR